MLTVSLSVVGGSIAIFAGLIAYGRYWIQGKYWYTRQAKVRDLKGKRVVITGANSGIGYETCYEFAKRGAEVVMVCRSQKRGQDALVKLQKRLPNASFELQLCDLASMDSVRSFLKQFDGPLHILVNNAGGTWSSGNKTQDGYEMTWQVNYLAPYLLTEGLLKIMKDSCQGNWGSIINVSSGAQDSATIHFDDVNNANGQYGQSKLAQLLQVEYLARVLPSNITTSAITPGLVSTNIMGSNIGVACLMFLFARSASGGCQVILHTADPNIPSGKYWSNCCQKLSKNPLSGNEAAAERLKELSDKQAKL